MSNLQKPVGFINENVIDNFAITSWIKTNDQRQAVNGVFKGGGPKGTAFAGAIIEFEKQTQWRAVAGTSAGAMTAALIAAGYDGKSYSNILKELDFTSLLDLHSLDDVQRAAYPRTLGSNIDIFTNILKNIDGSMLEPANEYKSEDKLRQRIEEYECHKMGWPARIKHEAKSWIGNPVKHAATKGLSSLVNGFVPSYLSTALKAYTGATSEIRKKAMMDFLMSTIGCDLPEPIKNKMLTNNELDYDKVISIVLGIYYKDGAFKGNKCIELMESYLQAALRDKEDLSKPVTFRELCIPCKVTASDLSKKRVLTFPDDLQEYGYDGKDGRMHYLDFSVAEAVKASMSLPLVFEPFYLPLESSKQSDGTYKEYSTLVDGGLLNNFPVFEFTDHSNSVPIFGFWLGKELDLIPTISTSRMSGYFRDFIDTLMEASIVKELDGTPEDFYLVDIDLTIPTTPEECENMKSDCQQQIVDISKQINQVELQLKKISKYKIIVEDDQKLVDLLELKEAVLRGNLDVCVNKRNEVKIETFLTRECGTLDFSLSSQQKDALIENGSNAAEKLLSVWKAKQPDSGRKKLRVITARKRSEAKKITKIDA